MVSSASVTVIGDTGPSAVRDVARRLEQFRSALGDVVADARRPLPLPTVVYVFGSRPAIQPFLPLRNGRPAALRGYFHRDADEYAIAMAVDEEEAASSIVFHEYTHLLVQHARTLPVWLNEGLAEYFSTFALTARGRTADIGRPIAPHVRLLRERFLPLAQLIAVEDSSALYDEGERRSIFYAEAWALTHYLMEEVPDGASLINRYGAATTRGGSAEQVFREVFGASPAEFEPRLREYISRATFRSRTYRFAMPIDADDTSPVRRLSDAEADAWLGDLQRRIGRQAEAGVRIERAGKDLMSADVAVRLGRLRLDQGRSTEARAALSRAIDLDPSSATAFGWMAYAQMMLGSVADARASVDRALALAPGRPDFRLRDADIAVLEGNLPRAKAILGELIEGTTDRAVAARALERLNVIDPRR